MSGITEDITMFTVTEEIMKSGGILSQSWGNRFADKRRRYQDKKEN